MPTGEASRSLPTVTPHARTADEPLGIVRRSTFQWKHSIIRMEQPPFVSDVAAEQLLPPARPRYRPPIGIPVKKERRTTSLLIAIGLHVLLILLTLVELTSPDVDREILGAGGPGPSGGGGGGNRGTGGQPKNERVQFIQVAPIPAPVVPPVIRPPVEKPLIPPPPPPVVPKPQTPAAAVAPAADDAAETKSVVAGKGGGAGTDGSEGAGLGKGGGTGTGVGTGTGTQVGPNTGGGPGTVYPPTPTELFLPPLPVPKKARGTIVVVFDVDSSGRVLDLDFAQSTKDGAYNRRLKEMLSTMRFRPGFNAQGSPVRGKAELTYEI